MAGQNTAQQRQGPQTVGDGDGAPSALDRAIGILREAGYQADTTLRSAADTLSFGEADRLAASLDALPPSSDGSTWPQRYQANLAAEQARDRYDAIHRPVAQALGQTIGAAVPLFAGDPEAALGAVRRLPGAAALSGREITGILAGGGATGVAMQHTSDALSGSAPSWRNDLGAAVGGVAGAAALPAGPARAAAVDGAVTSAVQDLANGRPVSVEHAGQSAMAARLLGGVAGAIGRSQSNALPMASKGRLGETLGAIRSDINGMPRQIGPKSRSTIPNSTKYWIPDGRSDDVLFEDKFGAAAELSPNQRLAQERLGSNFQLYHFLPQDIGKGVSVPAAAVGAHLVPQRRR